MHPRHADHCGVAGESDSQRNDQRRNHRGVSLSGTRGYPPGSALCGMARGGDCPPVGASPPVKFLADMGISPKTVAFLYALGHDAVHLADQGLERLPDQGIVAKARQEGRIVLVHDLGFGELVAASGATLPSVITFRLRNM